MRQYNTTDQKWTMFVRAWREIFYAMHREYEPGRHGSLRGSGW